MRYFVDTEFNGFGGELVSLAAVPETGEAAPFYEAVDCKKPTAWVRTHVLPVLRTRLRSLHEVARSFAEYLADDTDVQIIADWPEDIAHAARLLTDGKGGRLVRSEVQFRLLPHGSFSAETRSEVPHNAYYDALALRRHVLETEAALVR